MVGLKKIVNGKRATSVTLSNVLFQRENGKRRNRWNRKMGEGDESERRLRKLSVVPT